MSQSVLVICFGDSLTAGFQSPTRENPVGADTPYGDFLQRHLGEMAQVRTSGICGELTGDMVRRFGRDVVAHRPQYVVILGGTNDLGWNAEPRTIMHNLAAMYEQTIAAGGVPVPVTIPSLRVMDAGGSREGREWVTGHLARRRELNGLILDHAERHSLSVVDLFTATAEPGSGLLASDYSNDGLHLTTAGYRLFADVVYVRVLQPAIMKVRES